MNKTILIFLLLLLVSCEKEIKTPIDEDGRIFIDAILGYGEPDRINVNISQPIYGEESTGAESVSLYLEADGKPVNIERDIEYQAGSSGGVSYVLTDEIYPGQTLRLIAEAEGLPPVQTCTKMPEPLTAMSVDTKTVQAYKEEDPYQTSKDTKTFYEIEVTAEEGFDKEEYFGIQVCKRMMYDTLGTVPDSHWKKYEELQQVVEPDKLYVNAVFSGGFSISSAEEEIVVEFDGGDMRMISPKQNERNAIGAVYVRPSAIRLQSAFTGYIYTAEGDVWYDYEIYETYEYNVRVFRLSPEIFHFYKARYIIEWTDVPVHLGFSPVTYTYTNVEGGLGMFGAVACYESGWFRMD